MDVRRPSVSGERHARPDPPRAAYVDDEVWQAERERIFAHQWVVVGRVDDVAATGRLPARRRRRRAGARRPRRRRRARRRSTTCAATAGPSSSTRARRRARGSLGAVDPLPVPLVDLRPRRRVAPAPVPGSRSSRRRRCRSPCTRSASTRGAGSCSSTSRRPTARPLAEQLGAVVDRVRRYPLAELRRGVDVHVRRGAPTGRCSPRTTTSATTAARSTRSCATSSPRSGAAAPGWSGPTASRTVTGAWTFTTTGTSPRAPFAGPRRCRARHATRASWSTPTCCSASPPSTSPRSPCGRTGRRARRVVCDLLFHPDEIAPADVRPVRRRPSCGTSSTARTGRSARACSGACRRGRGRGGWFAPMEDESADISRWYVAAMAPDRDPMTRPVRRWS